METQNLAKWISELQAQIDQVKRLAIAAGSSGGDTVTITPALESGTKIADYTIGEDTSGSLYAPTPASPEPSIGPFVDLSTEHRIANGNFENTQLSYTATQDCVVLVNMANILADTFTAIKVDSGTLWSYSGAAIAMSMPVFLKSGQTITTVAAGSSQYNVYNVHPLLQATPPVTAKKTTKKK